MEKLYTCPKCKGHLRVGDNIVLTAKNTKKQRGIILLSPEIGNYTSLKNPAFAYEKGELLEFYCPLCNDNLASDIDSNLIHVTLIENGKEFDVYFSRIVGEKSTYKVNGSAESVTAVGENAEKYTYFKLPDKLKRYL